MENYKLTAPCLFGLEGIAANEFKRMGFTDVAASDGRVDMSGNSTLLARANICSRFAERIYIKLSEFTAKSFTELFDGVKNIEWENYLSRDDAFPVNGHCRDSELHSVPDCQKIIKKAIVERLKSKYSVSWFDETGPEHKIRFSVVKDKVTVYLDTSGEPLHKRGYRRDSGTAPIRETLAAAMCDLIRIYPDTFLCDPFCGSGTILVEAALMATNTAVGLRRFFASERYDFIDKTVWANERSRAMSEIRDDVDFKAVGFDLDSEAVNLTLANAKKAGVGKYISASVADFCDFKLPEGRMSLVTNPPYGERLLDVDTAEKLYRMMGEKFTADKGYKYCIISPDDDFEKIFGRNADKRRKVYNGMLKCQLYMYFKTNG